jgi:hypothetical protein
MKMASHPLSMLVNSLHLGDRVYKDRQPITFGSKAKRDFWDKLNLQMACVVVAMWIGATAPSPARLLPDLYRITDGVSHNHMEYHQLQVGKGQEVVLADLKGPGKVTYFYITDDTQVHWYSGLVLKVYWDDEAEPSIQTPLSDFFGAIGGKTIDYQSVPMHEQKHRNYHRDHWRNPN